MQESIVSGKANFKESTLSVQINDSDEFRRVGSDSDEQVLNDKDMYQANYRGMPFPDYLSHLLNGRGQFFPRSGKWRYSYLQMWSEPILSILEIKYPLALKLSSFARCII